MDPPMEFASSEERATGRGGNTMKSEDDIDKKSLLPMAVSSQADVDDRSEWTQFGPKMRRLVVPLSAVGLIAAVSAVYVTSGGGNKAHNLKHEISFTCPKIVEQSLNDNHGSNFDEYLEDDEEHAKAALDDYRKMKLDGWGITYEQLKTILRPWKEEVFVPNLKSGDSIYESACGIGLNLLLTTEILEEYSIKNVSVYGNDYLSESIDIANRVWSFDKASRSAQKGRLCRGDSTSLEFVPASSFDLVYTGYVDPIQDPLNLIEDEDVEDIDDDTPCWEQSVDFCQSTGARKKYFAEQEQLAQEDWWSQWVVEMIRIAKPGKVISIETNSESICKNTDDWGGVDKEWWSKAALKYGWDIDMNSILIRDVGAEEDFFSEKYHVMMRKSGKS